MASFGFRFPPKSVENRKVTNVCEYCRSEGMGAELAASKLKDGIVHLTIDQLEKAESNEDKLTRGDINRLWEALIDGACKKDCGCAQVLRQHIHCDELKQFWAATTIELSKVQLVVMKPKQNAKTNKAKKPETKVLNYDFESGRWEWTDEKSMQDDLASAPLGKNHAANRRYKKSKQRAKQAKVSTSTTNTAQVPLPYPAPPTGFRHAFGGLQHPITFVATLPGHQKPGQK